jgi:hypothetical protein
VHSRKLLLHIKLCMCEVAKYSNASLGPPGTRTASKAAFMFGENSGGAIAKRWGRSPGAKHRLAPRALVSSIGGTSGSPSNPLREFMPVRSKQHPDAGSPESRNGLREINPKTVSLASDAAFDVRPGSLSSVARIDNYNIAKFPAPGNTRLTKN